MAEETAVATPEVAAPAAPAAQPTSSWRDFLPEDIRGAKPLERYKDVAGLAKGFIELEKKIGEKPAPGLSVPSANATPDEIKAFHKALGVPESPAEYKLKAHHIMSHPQWNQQAVEGFLKGAHGMGFTPAQVDYAVQYYANFMGERVQDNTKMENEARAELRQEWGINYDTFLGNAIRAMDQAGQHAGLQKGELFEATKGDNPAAVAKFFHWLGPLLAEHGFLGGEPVSGVSAADATTKIEELKAQLQKVPEGSDQAKAIINQILAYGTARGRAA